MQDNLAATQLYRIAQEAVSNALRHSGAAHVRVELRSVDGTTSLRVVDNGAGINEDQIKGDGLGLRLMRYRAGLIGATLTVEPAAEGGTEVCCLLRSNHE